MKDKYFNIEYASVLDIIVQFETLKNGSLPIKIE